MTATDKDYKFMMSITGHENVMLNAVIKMDARIKRATAILKRVVQTCPAITEEEKAVVREIEKWLVDNEKGRYV